MRIVAKIKEQRFGLIKYLSNLVNLFHSPWAKLALIVGMSFLVRLVVYGFIRLPWIIFDEFIYLDTARQIVRGSFVSQLSRDSQLYPPGWSVILAAFAGFVKDPFFQYRLALWLTMLLSGLVPVVVYWLTGSLWASVAVAFYPPLFVYSSNIMSETFFILFLFILAALLKDIVKDDFAKRRCLIAGAVIMGLLIFYTRLIRSFGVVLLPALLLAVLGLIYWQYRHNATGRLRKFLFFSLLTVVSYYGFSYLVSLWFMPKGGFYERNLYVQGFLQVLRQPRLAWVLLRNELTLSLFWWLWVLPVYFVSETVRLLYKKDWPRLLPRIWAIFIYIFSLGLTLTHMFIGSQKNPQYLILSRYLDPALVLLFAYMVADFQKYIAQRGRLRIPVWLLPVLAYFIFYLVFKIPKVDYKFGNTMSVYFFLSLKLLSWRLWVIVGLSIAILYNLWRRAKVGLAYWLIGFFVISACFSIGKTLSTPDWVTTKYQAVANQWQEALSRYSGTDIPLCIYQDGVSTEIYYLYHFLYPYQYLHSCKRFEQKPKRILTRQNSQTALPAVCVTDYRFASGESLIYCPLGY